MSSRVHDRIEAIAGAIALNEATDEERREYREHIATCAACLSQLGGEREIERVAATVAAARETEVWQPELRDVVRTRMERRNRTLRFSFGVAGVCLAISIGIHALGAARVPKPAATTVQVAAQNVDTTRVALEQRPVAPPPKATPAPAPPPRRLIVEHNVVQITRAPVAAPALQVPKTDAKPQEIADVVVHAPPQLHPHKRAQSNIPVWRRNDADAWRTVAMTTTTSLSESAPQTLTHRAELIQVTSPHVTREALPIGGATAINPQPPMIAYDEGASGTSVFEVLIDERGTPTKCVITKSAGYTVLDSAVCKAAMQAHYTPKTIDGRPVPGVFRDAFTFRMSADQSEELPKPIQ